MILKFRAWNIDKKRMIYLSERMDNDIHMQINNRSWGIFEGSSSPAIANKHYGDVLMQYTGLYDKDKSELYDKDIVKAYSDEFESSPMIGVINWDKAGQWIFDFGDNKSLPAPVIFGSSFYISVHGIFNSKNIKKIGNIFENGNLLHGELKEKYMENNFLTVGSLKEKLDKLIDAGYGDMKIKCQDGYLHTDEIGVDYMTKEVLCRSPKTK